MSVDDRLFVEGDHLTDEDYANLTLLNDDQIAYEKMSDPILSRLALSGELYIATSSLAELDCRHSPVATETAAKVLGSNSADGHLRAIAFRILFESDPKQALIAIRRSIDLKDPVLLSEVAVALTSYPGLVDDDNARYLAGIIVGAIREQGQASYDAIPASAILMLGKAAE
jgi:hypothetical protein